MNLDWAGMGPPSQKQALNLMRMVLMGLVAAGRTQDSLSPDPSKAEDEELKF